MLSPICQPLDEGFAVPLRGGEIAQVRPVTKADQPAMLAAFEQLSAETRANRWLTPIAKMPSSMLNYLTEVDQETHVAWGIGLPIASNRPLEQGIGVGRYVHLNDEPDTAEFALTVVDAFQGKRIGTFLLALLYRLAQHQRISTLRGVIAPDHDRMLGWMSQLGAQVYHTNDGLMHADLAIDDPATMPKTRAAGRFGRIYNLIRAGEAQINMTPSNEPHVTT